MPIDFKVNTKDCLTLRNKCVYASWVVKVLLTVSIETKFRKWLNIFALREEM